MQAGTGITVTVRSTSATQITADFAVASNAPSGNHSVTVTAGGQTSNNSVNFFVQVPTTLSAPAPTVHTFTNQVATHCDGSPPNTPRWGTQDCFLYTLQDQDSPTASTITFSPLNASETLQWIAGDTTLPPATSGALTNGQFGDEIAIFSEGGPIPSTYQQTFLQTWTIKNPANNDTWIVRKNCVRWSGSSVTVTDVTGNPSSCN